MESFCELAQSWLRVADGSESHLLEDSISTFLENEQGSLECLKGVLELIQTIEGTQEFEDGDCQQHCFEILPLPKVALSIHYAVKAMHALSARDCKSNEGKPRLLLSIETHLDLVGQGLLQLASWSDGKAYLAAGFRLQLKPTSPRTLDESTSFGSCGLPPSLRKPPHRPRELASVGTQVASSTHGLHGSPQASTWPAPLPPAKHDQRNLSSRSDTSEWDVEEIEPQDPEVTEVLKRVVDRAANTVRRAAHKEANSIANAWWRQGCVTVYNCLLETKRSDVASSLAQDVIGNALSTASEAVTQHTTKRFTEETVRAYAPKFIDQIIPATVHSMATRIRLQQEEQQRQLTERAKKAQEWIVADDSEQQWCPGLQAILWLAEAAPIAPGLENLALVCLSTVLAAPPPSLSRHLRETASLISEHNDLKLHLVTSEVPEETTFPVLSPLTLISKALPSKLSTALQPSESKLQFNVRWQQFYEAASLPLSLLFCTAGSEAGEVCATKGWNDGTVGWGMKGGLQLFWLKPLQEPLLHCLKSLAAHQFQPSEMAAAMHHITNTLYALTATVILGLRMEIFLQRHAHHAKAFQNANEDAFVRRWQGQWGEMKHVMRPQNKEGCVKELLSATLGLIPLAESIVKELQDLRVLLLLQEGMSHLLSLFGFQSVSLFPSHDFHDVMQEGLAFVDELLPAVDTSSAPQTTIVETIASSNAAILFGPPLLAGTVSTPAAVSSEDNTDQAVEPFAAVLRLLLPAFTSSTELSSKTSKVFSWWSTLRLCRFQGMTLVIHVNPKSQQPGSPKELSAMEPFNQGLRLVATAVQGISSCLTFIDVAFRKATEVATRLGGAEPPDSANRRRQEVALSRLKGVSESLKGVLNSLLVDWSLYFAIEGIMKTALFGAQSAIKREVSHRVQSDGNAAVGSAGRILVSAVQAVFQLRESHQLLASAQVYELLKEQLMAAETLAATEDPQTPEAPSSTSRVFLTSTPSDNGPTAPEQSTVGSEDQPPSKEEAMMWHRPSGISIPVLQGCITLLSLADEQITKDVLHLLEDFLSPEETPDSMAIPESKVAMWRHRMVAVSPFLPLVRGMIVGNAHHGTTPDPISQHQALDTLPLPSWPLLCPLSPSTWNSQSWASTSRSEILCSLMLHRVRSRKPLSLPQRGMSTTAMPFTVDLSTVPALLHHLSTMVRHPFWLAAVIQGGFIHALACIFDFLTESRVRMESSKDKELLAALLVQATAFLWTLLLHSMAALHYAFTDGTKSGTGASESLTFSIYTVESIVAQWVGSPIIFHLWRFLGSVVGRTPSNEDRSIPATSELPFSAIVMTARVADALALYGLIPQAALGATHNNAFLTPRAELEFNDVLHCTLTGIVTSSRFPTASRAVGAFLAAQQRVATFLHGDQSIVDWEQALGQLFHYVPSASMTLLGGLTHPNEEVQLEALDGLICATDRSNPRCEEAVAAVESIALPEVLAYICRTSSSLQVVSSAMVLALQCCRLSATFLQQMAHKALALIYPLAKAPTSPKLLSTLALRLVHQFASDFQGRQQLLKLHIRQQSQPSISTVSSNKAGGSRRHRHRRRQGQRLIPNVSVPLSSRKLKSAPLNEEASDTWWWPITAKGFHIRKRPSVYLATATPKTPSSLSERVPAPSITMSPSVFPTNTKRGMRLHHSVQHQTTSLSHSLSSPNVHAWQSTSLSPKQFNSSMLGGDAVPPLSTRKAYHDILSSTISKFYNPTQEEDGDLYGPASSMAALYEDAHSMEPLALPTFPPSPFHPAPSSRLSTARKASARRSARHSARVSGRQSARSNTPGLLSARAVEKELIADSSVLATSEGEVLQEGDAMDAFLHQVLSEGQSWHSNAEGSQVRRPTPLNSSILPGNDAETDLADETWQDVDLLARHTEHIPLESEQPIYVASRHLSGRATKKGLRDPTLKRVQVMGTKALFAQWTDQLLADEEVSAHSLDGSSAMLKKELRQAELSLSKWQLSEPITKKGDEEEINESILHHISLVEGVVQDDYSAVRKAHAARIHARNKTDKQGAALFRGIEGAKVPNRPPLVHVEPPEMEENFMPPQPLDSIVRTLAREAVATSPVGKSRSKVDTWLDQPLPARVKAGLPMHELSPKLSKTVAQTMSSLADVHSPSSTYLPQTLQRPTSHGHFRGSVPLLRKSQQTNFASSLDDASLYVIEADSKGSMARQDGSLHVQDSTISAAEAKLTTASDMDSPTSPSHRQQHTTPSLVVANAREWVRGQRGAHLRQHRHVFNPSVQQSTEKELTRSTPALRSKPSSKTTPADYPFGLVRAHEEVNEAAQRRNLKLAKLFAAAGEEGVTATTRLPHLAREQEATKRLREAKLSKEMKLDALTREPSKFIRRETAEQILNTAKSFGMNEEGLRAKLLAADSSNVSVQTSESHSSQKKPSISGSVNETDETEQVAEAETAKAVEYQRKDYLGAGSAPKPSVDKPVGTPTVSSHRQAEALQHQVLQSALPSVFLAALKVNVSHSKKNESIGEKDPIRRASVTADTDQFVETQKKRGAALLSTLESGLSLVNSLRLGWAFRSIGQELMPNTAVQYDWGLEEWGVGASEGLSKRLHLLPLPSFDSPVGMEGGETHSNGAAKKVRELAHTRRRVQRNAIERAQREIQASRKGEKKAPLPSAPTLQQVPPPSISEDDFFDTAPSSPSPLGVSSLEDEQQPQLPGQSLGGPGSLHLWEGCFTTLGLLIAGSARGDGSNPAHQWRAKLVIPPLWLSKAWRVLTIRQAMKGTVVSPQELLRCPSRVWWYAGFSIPGQSSPDPNTRSMKAGRDNPAPPLSRKARKELKKAEVFWEEYFRAHGANTLDDSTTASEAGFYSFQNIKQDWLASRDVASKGSTKELTIDRWEEWMSPVWAWPALCEAELELSHIPEQLRRAIVVQTALPNPPPHAQETEAGLSIKNAPSHEVGIEGLWWDHIRGSAVNLLYL